VKTPQLAEGVLIEQVGNDLVVVVPGGSEAMRITGEAAQVLSRIHAGQAEGLSEAVVRDLAAQGIIEVPGLSRRNLITAGALGAGAGIAVLTLPGVAAASSGFPVLQLSVKTFEDSSATNSIRPWTFRFEGPAGTFVQSEPPQLRLEDYFDSDVGIFMAEVSADETSAKFDVGDDLFGRPLPAGGSVEAFLAGFTVGSTIPDGVVQLRFQDGTVNVVNGVTRIA
jgi:hypothetical protein